jgi:predicted nucleotidyltransferase
MKSLILSQLCEIEAHENVRIVYACESGSRAWGFPSADSDYDVRFLYVRPLECYLSIDLERDVIERPLQYGLDINGWDLKKALRLFRKSNPPLLEWLSSPIVYLEQYSAAESMRRLLPDYYSPTACLYHYLHMARGNYREYLKGDVVWIKKYFYVLRPILAMNWIERGWGVVPTDFNILVNRLTVEPQVANEIAQLLAAKRAGVELNQGPRIETLSRFIAAELDRWENSSIIHQKRPSESGKLDELFRTTLAKAWEAVISIPRNGQS